MSEWDQFQRADAHAGGSSEWDQFQRADAPAPRGAMDKLLGLTGERYQTWPERLVRDAVTVPQRTIEAAMSAPPGTREFTENVTPVATEAAMLASPLTAAARRGASAAKDSAGMIEQLTASAKRAYGAAEDAGAIYSPQAVQRLRATIQDDLAQFGYHPELQPRVKAALSEIDRLAEQNVSLKGVDVLRQIAGAAGESPAKSERTIAQLIRKRIDEMVTSPQTGDVVMGDAPGAAKAITEARDLWSRKSKMETIEEAIEKAQRRAASTGSGGNVDNAIRQNMRSVRENKSHGMTADEIAALDKIIEGTGIQNTLRLVGKLSPSGNGLMAGLGIGATAFNPMMAAAPLAGFAAKQFADKATGRNVEALQNLIAAGGAKPPRSALSEKELLLLEKGAASGLLGGSYPSDPMLRPLATRYR
jgi:hypothetical protein